MLLTSEFFTPSLLRFAVPFFLVVDISFCFGKNDMSISVPQSEQEPEESLPESEEEESLPPESELPESLLPES